MHVDVCQCGCKECMLMCVSVDVRNARLCVSVWM